MKGDLPGVCVRCGEATNQFPLSTLSYRGQRIRVCLPFCDTHKPRGRKSLPVILFVVGVCLFVLGLCLFMALVAAELQVGLLRNVLAYASLGATVLGLAAIAASLVLYGWLTARDFILFGRTGRRVRIRRLGQDTVTLMHVAPEFVEAYRVHCREKLAKEPL